MPSPAALNQLLDQYQNVVDHLPSYLKAYRGADLPDEDFAQLLEKQGWAEADLWHKIKGFRFDERQHADLWGAFNEWVRVADLFPFSTEQSRFFLSEPTVLFLDFVHGAQKQIRVHNAAAKAVLTQAGRVDDLEQLEKLIDRNTLPPFGDYTLEWRWSAIQLHLTQLTALLSYTPVFQKDPLWKDMGSAPKDGSTILVFDGGKSEVSEDGIFLARWSEGQGDWVAVVGPRFDLEPYRLAVVPLAWQDKPRAPVAFQPAAA